MEAKVVIRDTRALAEEWTGRMYNDYIGQHIIEFMDEELKYPPIVYKYRNWTDENHRNVLLNNELYLSSPKDFNDPFDCRIPENFYLLNSEEKINEYVEGFMRRQTEAMLRHGEDPEKQRSFLFDKLINQKEEFQAHSEKVLFARQDVSYGVLSLSGRWDSILMWSHYGDFHRGYCVGFHEEKIRNSRLFGRGGDVIYSANDRFPEVDPRDQNTTIKATIQTHSKAKDWIYEEEYRLTDLPAFPGIPTVEERKRFVKDDFFAELILGIQIPPLHREEIIEVAIAKGINVYQAVKVPFRFIIDRIQIA